MFDQLVHWYQSIPPETWVAILGAGGVSVVTQFGKKLLKLESEKVVQVFFAAVSFCAVGLQYLLGAQNLPPTFLGIKTAAVMGLATPMYFFAVKPLNNFAKDIKAYRDSQASKTAADAEVALVNPGPAFDEHNATEGLVETGAGAPTGEGTATVTVSNPLPAEPAPTEFTA